jgi:hypothetical protein
MSPLVAARMLRNLGMEACPGPLLRLTGCASPWSCSWGVHSTMRAATLLPGIGGL